MTLNTENGADKSDYPRERILRRGVEALNNAELIAAIIGTGSQQKSVMALAQQILDALPGGLAGLAGISTEELRQTDGVGIGKACQLIASVELGRRVYARQTAAADRVASPSDVAALLMSELRYKRQEHFMTVILDTKNQVISIETITVGTLSASLVHPREVFNRAIRKSACGIILVHNHPSGHPEPSSEDKLLTERLMESGKILGISVLDHVIIGNGRYFSFKESGLL